MKQLLLCTLLFLGVSVAAISRQDSTLVDYVGKYKFPDGSMIPYGEIMLSEGVLMVTSPAGTATLSRIEGDVFSIVEFNGIAEFIRNGDKKVSRIKISVMGIELEGTKEQAIYMERYHPLRPMLPRPLE